MRQVKVDLPTLKKGVVKAVRDSRGRMWEVAREMVGKEGEEQTEMLVLNEVPRWTIFIEGIVIGKDDHPNPAEAVRETFQKAGLQSLPEAVVVKAIEESGETYMVFTLDGRAYCEPQDRFVEVEKSSNWTKARTAKRPEIDALIRDLRKIEAARR